MDLNRNNMDLERFKLLTNAEMHRLTQALGARKKDTKEMLVQRWKDYLETQEAATTYSSDHTLPRPTLQGRGPTVNTNVGLVPFSHSPLDSPTPKFEYLQSQSIAVSKATRICLSMMQYPFTYQLKKDTDDISSTLQPLIDFTVVYVNIKSWSDRDDFISQVLRQMPSVQAPGLFVGFFKQFHIRVITPAGMDNYVELTMNEQAILRETEVVWRAVHYYWRSLLRSVSAAPVLSIPDLVWPEDFPQMDQRILRQFVSVHLQAVNEPLDKPEKELAVTTAIRTMPDFPVPRATSMVVRVVIRELLEELPNEPERKRARVHSPLSL